MSSENSKSKQQDSTTHLLEWSKSKTLKAPHANKDV